MNQILNRRRIALATSTNRLAPSVLWLVLKTAGKPIRQWRKSLMIDCTVLIEPDNQEVTSLLRRMAEGDRQAEDLLYPRLYSELRRLAVFHLLRERPGHTLQATALVNEAYLRLCGTGKNHWQNKEHFFATAAKVMRQVLVDYARQRNSQKRQHSGAEAKEQLLSPEQSGFVTDLDEAMNRLAALNPRQARVVELRFFGGMTEDEIATVLEISRRTVIREWRAARAWLRMQMKGSDQDDTK